MGLNYDIYKLIRNFDRFIERSFEPNTTILFSNSGNEIRIHDNRIVFKLYLTRKCKIKIINRFLKTEPSEELIVTYIKLSDNTFKFIKYESKTINYSKDNFLYNITRICFVNKAFIYEKINNICCNKKFIGRIKINSFEYHDFLLLFPKKMSNEDLKKFTIKFLIQ